VASLSEQSTPPAVASYLAFYFFKERLHITVFNGFVKECLIGDEPFVTRKKAILLFKTIPSEAGLGEARSLSRQDRRIK